jgi:polysaccharide pyruvyl transferase WcaK-like protein
MAEAVQHFLGATYGGFEYTVWSSEKPSPHHNAKWIFPPFGETIGPVNHWFENRALRAADMVILGGGSVLHTASSSLWKLRGLEYFKRHNPKGKAVGISISVGPFETKDDEAACAKVLATLDGCVLRDTFSYEFAKSCKLPYEPLLGADLAASYLQQKNIEPKKPTGVIETVGMCPRLPYRTDYDKTVHGYVELLKALCAKYRVVKLFAFSSQAPQDEVAFAQQIWRAAGSLNLTFVPYKDNAEEFTKEIKSCDFFLSSKLHGLVTSYLLNIPCLAISYQRKFSDFADDIKLPQDCRFTQADFAVDRVMNAVRFYEYENQASYLARRDNNFKVF